LLKEDTMKIVVLGGGSFGTALASQLAYNPSNEVILLVRDLQISDEVNTRHTNSKFFFNKPLKASVRASTDFSVIASCELLILCVPTRSVIEVAAAIKAHLSPDTLLVNAAKGILDEGQTIVEFLKKSLDHTQVISLKGASFSSEMINGVPTSLTVGFDTKKQLQLIKSMTAQTNLYVDYSTDVRGVELLSAIKNVYAILLGSVDAKFNAANTRFLVLTKIVSEIRTILKAMGGQEETIFLSCGIGDISLTALNDLSRNRTLGLLIGKGFYNSSFLSNSVVLEGVKTLKLIDTFISKDLQKKLPLLQEMAAVFIDQNKAALDLDFNTLFEKKFTTVLTYGTFDLLHFGHLEILRRAKELGDRLIVGLSTDEFNQTKGKKCEFPYEKRKLFLESLSYTDLVIPETHWEQKIEDVIAYDVDMFVMGDDWTGKFDFLKKYCEVIYLPRTKGISTTALKRIILK
jgi:glycerol-3-phosphate dehydrogenase (NAD(P)+)